MKEEGTYFKTIRVIHKKFESFYRMKQAPQDYHF